MCCFWVIFPSFFQKTTFLSVLRFCPRKSFWSIFESTIDQKLHVVPAWTCPKGAVGPRSASADAFKASAVGPKPDPIPVLRSKTAKYRPNPRDLRKKYQIQETCILFRTIFGQNRRFWSKICPKIKHQSWVSQNRRRPILAIAFPHWISRQNVKILIIFDQILIKNDQKSLTVGPLTIPAWKYRSNAIFTHGTQIERSTILTQKSKLGASLP